MQRFIYSLFLILSLFTSNTSVLAESPRWYEVELALISYQESQKINHENWPEILIEEDLPEPEENIPLTTPEDPWSWLTWWNHETETPKGLYNIQKNAINTSSKLETPFITQGPAFEDKEAKFEKSNGLQLVWSKKWRQPIPEKSAATLDENLIDINIKTALNFKQVLNSANPLIEIEVSGQLHLYRSRYLHLVSDLKVQHWQSLERNSPLDKSIKVLPNHPIFEENIIPSKSSTPLTAIDEVPLRAAIIKQSRRMRSNELHYIDHPLLGILVRVKPIDS